METTRAQQRRRTEQRILAAARELFAARGFERTTIRAVAAAAGVDPALVMQHFGNKQALFRRAVTIEGAEIGEGGEERPHDQHNQVDLILAALRVKLGDLSPATLAVLRAMPTHPEAARTVRDAIDEQVARISAVSKADDAQLRASLVLTMMLGIAIGRQILDVPAFDDADFTDIERILRPALSTLLGTHSPARAHSSPRRTTREAAGEPEPAGPIRSD